MTKARAQILLDLKRLELAYVRATLANLESGSGAGVSGAMLRKARYDVAHLELETSLAELDLSEAGCGSTCRTAEILAERIVS